MNKDKVIGLMTFHTLRYLHRDKEIEAEFYSCTSPEQIKALIWKRMNPLFKDGTKKTKSYSNVKYVPSTDISTINGKPKMNLLADEHVMIESEEKSRAAFLKGIKLCDFVAIYDWLCDQKVKKNPTTARAPQGIDQQLQVVKEQQVEQEVRLPYGE